MGIRLHGSCESFEAGFIGPRELGKLIQSGIVFWFFVRRVKSCASGKTLREPLIEWECLVRSRFLFMRIAVDYSLQVEPGYVACRRRSWFLSDAISRHANCFIMAMQLAPAVVRVLVHVTCDKRAIGICLWFQFTGVAKSRMSG